MAAEVMLLGMGGYERHVQTLYLVDEKCDAMVS